MRVIFWLLNLLAPCAIFVRVHDTSQSETFLFLSSDKPEIFNLVEKEIRTEKKLNVMLKIAFRTRKQNLSADVFLHKCRFFYKEETTLIDLPNHTISMTVVLCFSLITYSHKTIVLLKPRNMSSDVSRSIQINSI